MLPIKNFYFSHTATFRNVLGIVEYLQFATKLAKVPSKWEFVYPNLNLDRFRRCTAIETSRN